MALRKQPIAIPFAGGVETRQDPKQVEPVKLLDLQNAVFTRATTISKRNGYAALSRAVDGAGDYVDAHALATRDNELLLFADGHAYSYRPEAGTWSDAGVVKAAIASDAPLARSGTQQRVPDMAIAGGVQVVAWEDSRGGVWTTTLEAATGRVLRAAAQLDAVGERPRVIKTGDVLQVIWAAPTLGQLWIATVNPAAPSATPVGSVLTGDLSLTLPNFDGHGTSRPDGAGILAWVTSTGWRIGYIAASGVIGSAVTGLPSAGTYISPVDGTIAVALDINDVDQLIGVVWREAGTTEVLASIFDPSDLSVAILESGYFSEPLDVPRIAVAWDPASASGDRVLCVAVERAGATSDLHSLRFGRLSLGDVLDLTGGTLLGHGLVTRAWSDGVSAYVGAVHAVGAFPYVAVLELTAAAGAATPVAARLLTGAATGLPTGDMLASVTVDPDDARAWLLPLTDRIQLASDGDAGQYAESGIRLARLDFAAASAFQTAQLGRGLYLAAAAPAHYDGARWAEWSFHTAPDDGLVGVAGSGGSLTPSSTYSYLAWYEETDAQGELHQGGTSIPLVVTTGGADNRVTLTLPTLRLTRRGRVRIVVARSLPGDTSAYYLVTSIDPSDTTGSNRYVDNDATANTVTLVDDLSDIDLATRALAYTNGGTLSNDPAPCAGAVIAGGKSRLFWTDPSDPNLVRYSQQLLDGNAVECPPELALQVDPYGGAITALAVLDDNVVVFKERAVYVFGGPGPLSNPDLSADQFAFTPAQLVTGDAGCLSQDSVGQTPVGLLFQSSKGVLLLDRSRQLQRVGDPVEAWTTQTVRAATLLPNRTHVVLVCDGADGRALLLDYERGQWSTFTNHTGVDAVVVGGVYHYLRSDGRVFREDVTSYADDNAQIRMVIDTAWVKLAGYLQGWQRIYHAAFLGRYISPHTLRVSWRLDYEDGWREPQDLDVDDNWDPSVYGEGLYGAGYYGGIASGSTVYQRRIHIGRRCQAIRFRLEDVEATDARGASFELSELLLTGGVLGPAFRLPAARSN